MTHPLGEMRERDAFTKRALADIVRERMAARRLRQTKVALFAGISRSFLRSILRAEKGCSLSVFLRLCDGLAADPCELLKDVLIRRDALREQ